MGVQPDVTKMRTIRDPAGFANCYRHLRPALGLTLRTGSAARAARLQFFRPRPILTGPRYLAPRRQRERPDVTSKRRRLGRQNARAIRDYYALSRGFYFPAAKRA
jgi:hypothetical protein